MSTPEHGKEKDEVGHIARETGESPHTRWVIGRQARWPISGSSGYTPAELLSTDPDPLIREVPRGGPEEQEKVTAMLEAELRAAAPHHRLNLVLLFLSGGLIAEGLRVLLGK